MTQDQRNTVMKNFREKRITCLIATDIAARGLDFLNLTLVVNFDIPRVPEDYLHRIGRTSRMDASGKAISLVIPEEMRKLNKIMQFTRVPILLRKYLLAENRKQHPSDKPGVAPKNHRENREHSKKMRYEPKKFLNESPHRNPLKSHKHSKNEDFQELKNESRHVQQQEFLRKHTISKPPKKKPQQHQEIKKSQAIQQKVTIGTPKKEKMINLSKLDLSEKIKPNFNTKVEKTASSSKSGKEIPKYPIKKRASFHKK
jgi:superfamily II DNA/RNA helicase